MPLPSYSLVGRSWPDRRQDCVDVNLGYSGIERRKPVTVRDTDGTLVIKPSPDAFRFDDERIVSGLVPFQA